MPTLWFSLFLFCLRFTGFLKSVGQCLSTILNYYPFLFQPFFLVPFSLFFLNSNNMNVGHLVLSQMSLRVCFAFFPPSFSVLQFNFYYPVFKFTFLFFYTSSLLLSPSSECFNSDMFFS